ncbi:MAG: acyl-CoA mutase large subunit family protein [Bacteroides sp.]|nr:acyl-CoA mutase large subunit family protein [Ruminococcus flavefaciens]MCM1555090.1 acyl-CoA mutase large subunit family protein [Bacteroides sp.]MCM1555459.1 acyl-CoA mutase large subunit family protein [Bacteroides sp.]
MERERLFSEFPAVSTQEWMDAIVKDLKGADFNKKLVWKTPEGFNVNPFYRAEDIENIAYSDAEPGQFPYVRGNKTEGNNWEIRQDFHISDIAACNRLAAQAAAKGAEAVGLCVKEVNDATQMEQLLHGIDLTRTAVHFIGSRDYAKTLELFTEYLKKSRIKPEQVKGSINFDPLAYALLHGNYYQSLEKNIDECVAIFNRYAETLPHFRLLGINASLLHNAGAYGVQELGLALNWAVEYFARLTDKGLSIDTIAPRTTLTLGIGSNYFMETAKLRAARLLWAYMMQEFKPAQESSKVAFIHAEVSTWNKSVYDPYVNLLRSATEAMSAAIGGADSIYVNDFSEAFRDSDEFSARIARNQQIILKEESFFNRIVDPAAGSYYIENLTANMAEQAWKLFLEIEDKGGFAACYESGLIQDKVAECAAKRNEDLAKRKIVLTGVNQFPNLNEKEAEHIQKTEQEAPEAGKFKTIAPYHAARAFEELRLQTEAFAKKNGRRPKVFLLTCGNLAMRKARAGFATNFFGCLGYEIIDNAGFENGAQGAKAALESKADITVLCSSDEEYADLAAQVCPALKGNTHIVYAGAAADEEPFRALGVECFIHVRSNVLETLRHFQQLLIK